MQAEAIRRQRDGGAWRHIALPYLGSSVERTRAFCRVGKEN